MVDVVLTDYDCYKYGLVDFSRRTYYRGTGKEDHFRSAAATVKRNWNRLAVRLTVGGRVFRRIITVWGRLNQLISTISTVEAADQNGVSEWFPTWRTCYLHGLRMSDFDPAEYCVFQRRQQQTESKVMLYILCRLRFTEWVELSEPSTTWFPQHTSCAIIGDITTIIDCNRCSFENKTFRITILNVTEELIVLGDRDRGALRPSLKAPHIDTPTNLHIYSDVENGSLATSKMAAVYRK